MKVFLRTESRQCHSKALSFDMFEIETAAMLAMVKSSQKIRFRSVWYGIAGKKLYPKLTVRGRHFLGSCSHQWCGPAFKHYLQINQIDPENNPFLPTPIWQGLSSLRVTAAVQKNSETVALTGSTVWRPSFTVPVLWRTWASQC